MSKKIISICLIIIIFLYIIDSIPTFANQTESTPQDSNSQAESELNPYFINETSSIKSDFHHLGIERIKYKNLEDILRSELISMFGFFSLCILGDARRYGLSGKLHHHQR